MHNKMAATAICIAAFAMSAAAQTTVITSGTTSSGTVPVFNGAATVTNSPITVSGGNVGIGTNSPSFKLDVAGGIGNSPQNSAMGYLDTGRNITPWDQTFENSISGWSPINDMTLSQSTTYAYSGTHSFALHRTDSSGAGGAAYTLGTLLKPGSNYTLSGYYMTPGDTGSINVYATTNGATAWSGGTTTSMSLVASSSWKFFSLTFVGQAISGSNNNYVWIDASDQDLSDSVYFDDLVLTEGSLPATHYGNFQTLSDGSTTHFGGNVQLAGTLTFPDGSTQSTSSAALNSTLSTSNGSVGIGTTSPTAALQIGSAVNTTTHLSLVMPNWDTTLATGGYAYFVGGWSAPGYWGIGPLNGNTTPTLQIGNVAGGGAQSTGTWASTQNLNLVVGGNVGIGTTAPGAKLDVAGAIHATGIVDASATTSGVKFADGNTQTTAWTGVLCGGDYAEAVDAKSSPKAYEPGDVLVIGDSNEGEVQRSAVPYSTMVAGIFATKPGVIGRRQSLVKDAEEIPMAMVGIVPTKVTAENGPIHRGDLLVTSSTTGYAMKGTDRNRLIGAVIGKAMGTLDTGTGVIEVLVTLQ